jgi:hypothetical protein
LAFNPPLANDKGKVGIDEVVANVPDVGKVTLVAPVNVRVAAYAPLVVKLPPSVTVDEPLLIPVPPYVGEIIVPPQTPVPIMPTLDSDDSVVTAELTSVPEVGRVTLVAPVTVNVVLKAPLVVKFPPSVMVDAPLFTPVPP